MNRNSRLRALTVGLLLCVLAGGPVAAQQSISPITIIYAGSLFDPLTGQVARQQSIQIEAGRVVALADGYIESENDAQIIDLKDYFVMPGLLDMHVHITSEASPARFLRRFTWEPADLAYESVVFAERTLLAGFTTVRDLGTAHGLAQAMRDAINRGAIIGPRVFTAAKSLATTGGHADPTNGMNEQLRGDPGPAEGVINSPAEAAKAVRARYKEGADLIKITATGGVLSEAKSGENPQFTIAEIEAVVATARDYGFKVAAHAHGEEGMRRAVVGGVDSIEHGTYMSDRVMKLMKKHGTWYVPTIVAGMFVAEKAEIDGYFSALVRPKAAAIGPQIKDTFARAYQAGVKIAFGTDTGVSPHGDNWREFLYMVEAGMPAAEALTAATVSAAELLGKETDLGQLASGFHADVIAFRRSPLEDITAMGEVAFVMKGGRVFKE